MSAKMMQFVSVPPAMPDKRGGTERTRRFRRDLRPLRARAGGRAGLALRAVRRAVLPGPLPAAQQHPRLAAAGRRGAARGGLRAVLGHQQHARDLRPDLPAGPAVRGQLRHRAVGPRLGHHRRGREVHHRHRLRSRLGQAGPAAARAGPVGRHHRRRPRRPRLCRGAAPRRAGRSMSTTATTGSAAC